MGLNEEFLVEVQWRKSSHSAGQGACIELAVFTDGDFAIRNSNRQHLGVITSSKEEMAAFIAGVKDGEYDDLLT